MAHDLDEFAPYAASELTPPRAAAPTVHDLDEFGQYAAPPPAAPAALTPSGLPRQTGKRFIEPPEDQPTLQDEQIAALGVAPAAAKTYPQGPTIADLQAQRAALESSPGAGERVLRNINRGIPFVGPYTDEIGAAVAAPFEARSPGDLVDAYRRMRDAQRARDAIMDAEHPVEGQVVRTAAGLVPIGLVAKGAQTANQVMQRAFALGFTEGLGRSDADLTRGEVIPALNDAALSGATSAATAGAISKLVRGAPERVNERIVANTARGEAGGAAARKTAAKFTEKAGEGGAELDAILERFPGLKKTLATVAATSPQKAANAVQERIDGVNFKLNQVYDQIEKGGGRTRLIDLVSNVDKLRRDMIAQGRAGVAEVVDRFRQSLVNNFGTNGKVPATATLTPTAMRNLRREVGQIAFGGNPIAENTPLGVQAKQMIYGSMSNAIEKAAQTAGVDVAKLRALNADDSMLLSVLAPLKDRAAKAAAGGTSFAQGIAHGVAPVLGSALGFGAHGVEGAAAGALSAVGLLAAKKAAGPLWRGTDYQLARLVEAARRGDTPSRIGQIAVELGLSRVIGEEVGSRLGATLSPRGQQPGSMSPAVAVRALGAP